MSEFEVQRLGLIMEPEAGNTHEVEGVLNPAAVRGRDGQLYLFPRLVAQGNYSRIGIARVLFDAFGDPVGVERLGIALEPEADYELRADGGGCEESRLISVMPKSASPCSSPMSVLPSALASIHSLSSPNFSSTAVSLPSRLLSRSAMAR